MRVQSVQVLFTGGECRKSGGRRMKRVALSLPKPPGSSLVPLHMTWLSFFESISSSALTPWTPAKSGRRGRESVVQAQNVA